ncbi:MAG: hypothetical protein GOP50_12055 [Candidatus Heimdallarchaeota archaeon]|nr:hypothetical protein [Candidatus Heimdallarchaeota archaeon]
MKSILKRGKNKEEDSPKKYNGFLEFNHKGIISNSKSEENPLVGCEYSDTLYLEADKLDTPIGLIFTGDHGQRILNGLQDRFKNSLPSSVILGFSSNLTNISDISNIELPEENREVNSFLFGKRWYQENENRIKSYIDKTIKNRSSAFIFLDNNPFILGLMEKVIEYIKEMKVQPVLFVHLPLDESKILEEFSALVFIYNLLKKETKFDVPIILVDEKYSVKLNSNVSNEELPNLTLQREANVVADILIGTLMKSEFYQTDHSNFTRIFENTKGICQLFSLDIYDNKPDLSVLFKHGRKSTSYASKELPTRGYVVIQPGPEGLRTDAYQNIREYYGNSDIILSILNRRTNGAIVRGIFSYISTPKILTDRYSKLDKIAAVLYDSEHKIIVFNKQNLFEHVLSAEKFELEIIDDTKNKA